MGSMAEHGLRRLEQMCGSADGIIRPIKCAVIGGNQQKRRLGRGSG